MAEIIGNIATTPEARIAEGSGQEYFVFRLAENSGRGDARRTTWFDVRAKIPQAQAALLASGHLVKVRGRLEPQAFVRKKVLAGVPVPSTWDEIIKVLREREALGASMVLLTSSVEPHELTAKDQQETP